MVLQLKLNGMKSLKKVLQLRIEKKYIIVDNDQNEINLSEIKLIHKNKKFFKTKDIFSSLYFFLLGLGFISFEIALIQQFEMFCAPRIPPT